MKFTTLVQTAWQQLISIVEGTIELLPNILIAIVVSILFWIIAKLFGRFIGNFVKEKQSRNLGLLLVGLSQGFTILKEKVRKIQTRPTIIKTYDGRRIAIYKTESFTN